MNKRYLLLAIASFGIFALAGCGKATETTTNTAAKNTAGAANTAAPKTDAPPASTILKPGDVSPDKAVSVADLVDSVAAATDQLAWLGKEVTVTGFVNSTSESGGSQLLALTSDKTAIKNKVTCSFKGALADGVAFSTVTVKGKIKSSQTSGESKSVDLEPCELKK